MDLASAVLGALRGVVEPSYGPLGLDAMLLSCANKVLVTNSGAQILEALEIRHPYGKVALDAVRGQAREHGDGSTGLLLMAAAAAEQLSSEAARTVDLGGTALQRRLRVTHALGRLLGGELAEHLAPALRSQAREAVARTALAGKIGERAADVLARLLLEAAGPGAAPGSVPPVVAAPGAPVEASRLLDGYVVEGRLTAPGGRPPEGPVRVAVYLLPGGARVGAEGAAARLEEAAGEAAGALAEAGAGVLVSTEEVTPAERDALARRGVASVQCAEREDAMGLAAALGARPVAQPGPAAAAAAGLGAPARVRQVALGPRPCVLFEAGAGRPAARALLVRAPTEGLARQYEGALRRAARAVASATAGQEPDPPLAAAWRVAAAAALAPPRALWAAAAPASGAQAPRSSFPHVLPVLRAAHGAGRTAVGLVSPLHAAWPERMDLEGAGACGRPGAPPRGRRGGGRRARGPRSQVRASGPRAPPPR
eukprot:tig00000237_g20494.t1